MTEIAARAAAEKLADNIVAIDVSDRLALSDVFVIASAANERQVLAVVDEVEDKLRDNGFKALRREGYRDARWVLIDYGDIVVHVMHQEDREFYGLERLWKDCPVLDVSVSASSGRGDGTV
nr:ribosome silencing factor [Spelaeicoccus albus]